MPAQEWFESFFVLGRYADVLAAIPAERTEREVSFMAGALGLPEGARILDLCCGVGRHTISLAQRGYEMAGLDLNADALAVARKRAEEAGVGVLFHEAEMRSIPYSGELDAVINIFSSWAYYPTDEEDAEVLLAVSRSLQPGGLFLLDTGNRERTFRQYRASDWESEPDGTLVLTRRELDLATSRHRVTDLLVHPDGSRSERWHQFRFYSLTELIHMLSEAGLCFRQAWGDFDASPYTLEGRRMIVLAQKTG